MAPNDALHALIVEGFTSYRKAFEKHFDEKLALAGETLTTRSSGHCAIVAVIIHRLSGGALVSTETNGQSHWWNRFTWTDAVETLTVDVDLTGDQFGFPEVNVSVNQELYPDSKVRVLSELKPETWTRAMDMLINMFASEYKTPNELRSNS